MRILISALQIGGGIRTFFRYFYSQPWVDNCSFVLVAPDNGLSDYVSQYLPEGRINVVQAESRHILFVRKMRRLLRGGDFQLVQSRGFASGLLTELSHSGIDFPPFLPVESRKLEFVPHVVTLGWGGLIREAYQCLNEKGLGDYFHQAEQADSMPSALKAVDVVAKPSLWEACGLLAMEALAAGTTIIGTERIGLREVIDGSPAQKVAVGDSAQLASAIVSEITNLPARKSEFLGYQNTAATRFNVNRPANELAELYNQLVPTSPNRA